MSDALPDNFDEHQRQGMEARRAGRWEEARRHFLQAADLAISRSRNPALPEARERFRLRAQQLLDLAKDCQAADREGRAAPAEQAAPAELPPRGDSNVPVVENKSSASRLRKPTYDLFERYRDGAISAWRRRDWKTAESLFSRAAETIEQLAGETTDAEQRDVRLEMARKLREKSQDAASSARGVAPAGRRPPVSSSNPSAAPREAEGGPSADQWLVKERPSVRFTDVAGLEDVKGDIRLKMIYPFSHPELAAKFGIRGGGGLLLYGPPGTGKTMLAKATAGELDAAFFRVTAADMLSKWVGEAEQNIKKLFDAAASEPRSVIFIDEIESLIPARQDEGSSVMQRVVPQILQGMEGFDKTTTQSVLFMGATNVPWQLDPAVLRPGRFDEKVYIPLPDIPARRQMLAAYLSRRPLAAEIDLDAVAKNLEGFSGADIKYICDRAATIPFLQSVATGEEGNITLDILNETIASAPKSVTPEMIHRFQAWAKSLVTR